MGSAAARGAAEQEGVRRAARGRELAAERGVTWRGGACAPPAAAAAAAARRRAAPCRVPFMRAARLDCGPSGSRGSGGGGRPGPARAPGRPRLLGRPRARPAGPVLIVAVRPPLAFGRLRAPARGGSRVAAGKRRCRAGVLGGGVSSAARAPGRPAEAGTLGPALAEPPARAPPPASSRNTDSRGGLGSRGGRGD